MKVQDWMASMENSETYKKELTPFPLKQFWKIDEEKTVPNSFYETTVTLIPKPKTL